MCLLMQYDRFHKLYEKVDEVWDILLTCDVTFQNHESIIGILSLDPSEMLKVRQLEADDQFCLSEVSFLDLQK